MRERIFNTTEKRNHSHNQIRKTLGMPEPEVLMLEAKTQSHLALLTWRHQTLAAQEKL